MKITPLEIRQHEFEKTFRGYNIEEVESFLVNLSQEWERVLNESKMLRMQLEIAEKEANKLREIEMTLYKTLKTAEDTSTMITDQANQQADKHIQETKLYNEKLLMDAQQKANGIVRQAEEQARYIKEVVLGDVKVLERDFRAMDHYKTNLLAQMRSLSTSTLEHVQRFEEKFDKEGVNAKFKEATSMLTIEEDDVLNVKSDVDTLENITNEEVPEILDPVPFIEEDDVADITSFAPETVQEEQLFKEIILVKEVVNEVGFQLHVVQKKPNLEEIEEIIDEEPVETTTNLSSSVNNFIEPKSDVVQGIVSRSNSSKSDELDIIEGIGPKIAVLLNEFGILTFRDLAITPVYKIQEILENAGAQFARHDPSTWTQQAKLAAAGRWNDLEDLKLYLVGGREPKKDEFVEIEEPIIETPSQVQSITVSEEIIFRSETEPNIVKESKSVAQVSEEIEETIPSFTQTPFISTDNNLDSITEEMLEKVNKVKAAIRKAMVEKNEMPVKDNTPLTTLNDVIAKNESPSGSSFFDNL
jgi:cell division initiation protein